MKTYHPDSGLTTLPGILADMTKGSRVRRADWPAGTAVYIDATTETLMIESAGKLPRPFAVHLSDLTEHAWDEVRA